MTGGGSERGRGQVRGPGRGTGRGHSYDDARGPGSNQYQSRRSSSVDSGSSSSSRGSISSRERDHQEYLQRQENRRLREEYQAPVREGFNIPIKQGKGGKPKAKPPPKEYEDFADVVGYQSTPSPVSSRQTSRTPSPGEVNTEDFPVLRKSHEKSQGSESTIAPVDSQIQVPPPDKETAFKWKFRELLNKYYQAVGELNSRSKKEILKIKFDYLLKEEYIELAIEIKKKSAEDKQHMWLQTVAQEFLNTWFKYEAKSDKRRLRFKFIREPKAIFPLSAFTTNDVVQQQPLYEDRYTVVRTTRTGRLVYLSVLNHVLTVNKRGRSWKGKFLEKHIYVVSYHGKGRLRCLILARTYKIYELLDPIILDLQMVNTVLTPRYELDNEFPAFFTDLKADLEGLTGSSLRESGILAVLSFHYSLMTPAAWGFLVWKVHLVVQQLKLSGTNFRSLFGVRVIVDEEEEDWRAFFKNSEDDVLKGVYSHDNDPTNDKFTNDLQGMSDCDRHLVQHAHHHPKSNPVRVHEPDESELFAACKMPLVVPGIVRGLFKKKKMQFEKQLGQVYEDYCKLCYDPDVDTYDDLDDSDEDSED